MAKKIKITFKGEVYTLEYTRKSVEAMERRGLKLSELSDKPMTTLPLLFTGAFLAHHKFLKQEVIDEIFAQTPNREDLLHTLIEMYNEPVTALMSDPEENSGNASCTLE